MRCKSVDWIELARVLVEWQPFFEHGDNGLSSIKAEIY
jgi:hypothetical protein